MMREIPISAIENVAIGSSENIKAATGCTVLLCLRGAPTGVDVRGGGPASRETELLAHSATCDRIHAVLLSGGSAFSLDAAGGVMRYLEERGIGVEVGGFHVPLVCQSCIFDLAYGDGSVRPDGAMAYAACVDAELGAVRSGQHVGAGAGATVGKLCGMEHAMKSGLGVYAVQLGALQVGAVVAVNAFGDVLDAETGAILAGMTDESGGFADSEATLYRLNQEVPRGNTTIGAIVTNAAFSKAQMTKIAQMAQDGYSRTIRPVHTTADGDTIYAMSVGDVSSDVDLVGTLAARVMAVAVNRAAWQS